MFQQKVGWNRIENLDLRLLSTDSFIPAHILAHHWVASEIYIECEYYDSPSSLQIHRDAFWSSRKSTQLFYIFNCNISDLNFIFLEEFSNLTYIFLRSSIFVQLASLPPLPSLKYLNIQYNRGLELITMFPNLVNGIVTMQLNGNNIDDMTIDRILKWILESPSVDTLKELDISRNVLTKIPHQIASFNMLNIINLGSNPLNNTLRSGSIIFRNDSTLYLDSCGIEFIEPGAFQGTVHITSL